MRRKSTPPGDLTKKRKGFTLLEALLAAAVVGIAGYVLVVSFNNGQMALLNWETSSELDAFHQWSMQQIDFETMDLDVLEKGDSIQSPEGLRMEWFGNAEPTRVLDVFVVEVSCTVIGSGGFYQTYTDQRIVTNPSFYENSEKREKLVEEKQDYFEDQQNARKRL